MPDHATQHATTPATPGPSSPFSSVEEVLADLRAGKMAVVTDAEDRENEGDLILPAQFVSPESVVFMLKEAAGYMFVSLTEADCDRLDLHWQTPVNTSARGTPLTVSVDGHPKHGFTTGVSAFERAETIKRLIDPASGPADFVRPGHINPLRSRDGGVLVRTGHTEAIVDLCRLAGLTPACIGIEIMREDGRMARVPDLEKFCARHAIRMCSIAQIIEHRLARESLVRRAEPRGGTRIRTAFGEFDLIAFESIVDPLPHLALTLGGVGLPGPDGRVPESTEPTLVRMHRRSLLGDVFYDLGSSPEPDSSTGHALHASMRRIQEARRGAIVYLRPEGRPTHDALDQRLLSIRRPASNADATDLTRPDEPATPGPDQRCGGAGGAEAVGASQREFGIGSAILRDLGLRDLRLLTNHPRTLPNLEAFGLRIVGTVGLDGADTP